MNQFEAEKNLEFIYTQLAKSELFDGYRPFDLYLIGAISLIFTLVQPLLSLPGTLMDQWMVVAFLIGSIVLFRILQNYRSLESGFEKRKTITVLSQYIPALAGGLIIYLFLRVTTSLFFYLPGILTILFGIGATSMIPYLSKKLFYPIALYLLGGAALLYLGGQEYPLLLFRVFGLIFTGGHWLTAFIIKREVYERKENEIA